MNKPETISIVIPKTFIVFCADYHDFDTAKELYKIMGVKTKYKELEMQNGFYRAEFTVIGTIK